MDAVGALDVYFQDRDDIDVGSAPEKVRSRKACLGFTAWDFSMAAAIRPSPSNRCIYRADEVVTTTPALTHIPHPYRVLSRLIFSGGILEAMA
jgi:hypothetical protein